MTNPTSEPQEVFVIINKNFLVSAACNTKEGADEQADEYLEDEPKYAPYRVVPYVPLSRLTTLEAVRVASEKLRAKLGYMEWANPQHAEEELVELIRDSGELERALAQCEKEKSGA